MKKIPKTRTVRTLVTSAVLFAVTVGFVSTSGIGTLSALGWSDVSLICPLGALTAMISTRSLIPQALVSLVFFVLAVILIGRAFCAWVCPVPLVAKLRGAFAKQRKQDGPCLVMTPNYKLDEPQGAVLTQELDAEGKAMACSTGEPTLCSTGKSTLFNTIQCASCGSRRRTFDSRHLILGGALLSAAIFGFPVFCMVCPLGLSFASILLVIRLFALGDITWSLLIVPALLIIEVVLFRRWCSNLCPLSALMSLVAKLNCTLRPSINKRTCIETIKGSDCGVCAKVCPEKINPRYPERGASWSECTRCHLCTDSCPTHSITLPLLPQRKNAEKRPLIAIFKGRESYDEEQ